MTRVELYIYVLENQKSLIAEACKHLYREDGLWVYWGEVALCIYYDEWNLGEPYSYKIMAFALKEIYPHVMEEDLDTFVHLAVIEAGG